MRRIARPYATALLGAAGSLDEAARTHAELVEVMAATESVPALSKMTVSPRVPLEVKQKTIASVAEAMQLSPLTRRFLDALVTRFRWANLSEIVEGVGELIDERRGVVVANVAVAEPLDETETARLKAVLEKKVAKGVRLDVTAKPELIAGFVVRVGSTQYDASLRGQLDRLTAELARA